MASSKANSARDSKLGTLGWPGCLSLCSSSSQVRIHPSSSLVQTSNIAQSEGGAVVPTLLRSTCMERTHTTVASHMAQRRRNIEHLWRAMSRSEPSDRLRSIPLWSSLAPCAGAGCPCGVCAPAASLSRRDATISADPDTGGGGECILWLGCVGDMTSRAASLRASSHH